jgi:hypothetical protein
MKAFGRSAIRRWPFCCVLLAFAAPVSADEAPAAVRTQNLALTHELMDALVPGKADVWQRILADDVLITDEFGRRQDKAEAVRSIHPFPAGISGRIEVRDPHVRVYGDTAVIDCEQYETEDFFGQKFVVRYLATATYVRRDGAWKLAAFQDVTLPTPPPDLHVRDIVLADYPGTYHYASGRAFVVELDHGRLMLRTRAGAQAHALDAIAKDVFMGGDDERNLLVFRRDRNGRIATLVERRKFNDLHATRDAAK